MIIKKRDIRIFIIAEHIMKSTIRRKEELDSDHNNGLIINDYE